MQINKTYIIAGVTIVAALLVGGFIFYTGQEQAKEQTPGKTGYELIASDKDVVLMADTGLQIEWLESEEDGRRQIFERYRLVDKVQFDNFTGQEQQVNSIDITQNNAEVFLTRPDGMQENIASDVPYILFPIFPPEPAGTYKLDIKLDSGEEYNFDFEFKAPKEVQLVNTGETQTLQIPDAEHDVLHRSKAELKAYALGSLNLNRASKVLHITPGGSVYGGALGDVRASAGIDEYFWMDTELMGDNYDVVRESIVNLQQADRSELGETELEYLKSYERPSAFEHIFLANINGVWHYAKANYPEDF